MLRVILQHSARISRLEEANKGRQALEEERNKNTSGALTRIEAHIRRVEDKIDAAIIAGVKHAVSQ